MPARGTNLPAKRRPNMEADARWHLDKKVPIALLLAILAQTAGGFWWASSLTERVSMLERSVTAAAPQADRLTRVEARLESVQDGIIEIKRMLQLRPTK